jgi:outer membrane protein insertion porin family
MWSARPGSRSLGLIVLGAALLVTAVARPEETRATRIEATPALRPAPSLGPLETRPIDRIEILAEGPRWREAPTLRRVRVGDRLTPYLVRVAMRELADTGRYAAVRATAEARAGSVVLVLHVVPRRVVGGLRLTGASALSDEALGASGINVGDEVTDASLADHARRITAFYGERGFPHAVVSADAVDTDDPLRVLVLFQVEVGPPRKIARRRIEGVSAPSRLAELAGSYDVAAGDRADGVALTTANRELQRRLRSQGWHRATVAHRLSDGDDPVTLTVEVTSGPRLRIRFEGVRSFDVTELESAIESEDGEPVTQGVLVSRLRQFYQDRGFFDVEVTAFERGRPEEPVHDLVLRVRERQRVRVVAREFPCLTGDRTPNDVGREIDGVLSEALPGADLLTTVDGTRLDAGLGPKGRTGARPEPIVLNPWNTYSPEAYERATEHLRELYRSEGYLSAAIGPVAVLRRRCDPRDAPGSCRPTGVRVRPPTVCPKSPTDLPEEDPPLPAEVSCEPDPVRGVRCEPEVVLHIPVKLGPRAILWDAVVEGSDALVEGDLLALAELDLGEPVSQVELEKARRRILDAYAEEGFAFATVEMELDLSPDRTRARARFIVSERERVRVKDIVVRGARLTKESLILGRVMLRKGDLYRRSAVRETEELLATLGVFGSVTVGLEDPEVPAREKVVVISVTERPPQYLDVRPGFSTGEGFRVTFEYGHRNLGGEAIQLVFRVQLGYLPGPLILDPDVRRRYEVLPDSQRLERRNTLSVEFPEIGLGPRYRLGVDGIDVRDNARDYGLTKNAVIVTLSYRPTQRFTAQLGASVERNDARVFDEDEKRALENILSRRLPDGTTIAFAQRTGITWDRRDDPFSATRGTFFSGGVEHVRALPAAADTDIHSHFLKFTNRVAGYVPFSRDGLSLALSFRWGTNTQLAPDSETYPDRLFFFGGVDSIRGFLQDSVIPQDLAARIGQGDPPLAARDVVLRGGNFMMNPRAELRIPLGGVWATALFADAGNLWLDVAEVNPFELRYAAGTGLRANTPIGPLALDLGANLDRRSWEDRLAFHFSIGLF